MGLSRDSLLLWLAIGGSLIGYFAAADKAPNQWNWHEWMQFGIATIGVISAKLQTSPLPSKEQHDDAKALRAELRAQDPEA